VPFVADDLSAWLIGLLADVARRRLIALVLGSDQERELARAASAAVELTVGETWPQDSERADELVRVVNEVFSAPNVTLARAHGTILESLQAGMTSRLSILDDASLTGTGLSSAQVLGVSTAALAEKLAGHLVQEIVVRGARGGPLEPLATQLNHDVTHLQGQRIERMVTVIADQVREAIAWQQADQLARGPATERALEASAPAVGRPGDPALAAYLRWIATTHGHIETVVAGRLVAAPLAEAPWGGRLVSDGSSGHVRQRETQYLHSLAGPGVNPGEVAVSDLAARPLPTNLTPASPVDYLDLTNRDGTPARELPGAVWRCLILGDPGSGKTTMARRFALEQATADGGVHAAVWRLPVLCRAVDLGAAIATTGAKGTTWQTLTALAITAGWDGAAPADPLSGDAIPHDDLVRLAGEASDANELLLVIDGLDEVPTRDERAGLVAALNRMVERDGPRYGLPGQATGHQLVVTSRLVGYYATPLSARVQQLILQPMDTGTALETGRYWLRHYAAAAHQGQVRTRKMEENLGQAVVDGAAVAPEVSANPFLLTSLVSAVASDRLDRGSLRAEEVVRGDLYEFLAEDALNRAAARFPGATVEFLGDLQAAAAYQMHRTSRTGVFDIPALLSCVGQALADMATPTSCPAELGVEYLLHGFGLLIERGQDLYGFRHLSLEEYFAGRYLADIRGADTIRAHLGDPRWVEPIRFGLGHVCRHDPARLGGLLDDLLSGPGGQDTAHILGLSIRDLRGLVAPRHIEGAVTALLTAEVDQVTAGDQALSAAAALMPMLSAGLVLQSGERLPDIVSHALADALQQEAMWPVAVAARTVEELQLFTRQTAEALFEAQERDGEEYGWATVRALVSMAASAGTAARSQENDAVTGVWAGLSQDDQAALSGVAVSAPLRPVDPAAPRWLVPRSLTPFRNAFDQSLIEKVTVSPALSRLVYCLYGGFAFDDSRRWAAERARAESELNMADTDEAVRRGAAVRLDTVLASAFAVTSTDWPLSADHITVDSPLTTRLLDWIGAEEPVRYLIDRLCELVHDPAEDSLARGDALAAWCVLSGDEVPSPVRSYEVLDAAARRRFAWRVSRAAFLLGDAAARLSTGHVMRAFEGQDMSPEDISHLGQAVTRALSAVAGIPPRSGGWGERSISSHIQELLVSTVCGVNPDKIYSLVVILDVEGRTLVRTWKGIQHLLATAHLVVAGYEAHSPDWDLDPFAPCTEPLLPEALTSLACLGADYGFMRCWMLDRMASDLVAAGFTVEAVCLALSVRPYDPASAARTIGRFAGLVDDLGRHLQQPDSGRNLLATLTAIADKVADPYARARSRLYLARLSGTRLDYPELTALAVTVHSPVSRLRLLELAIMLGVAEEGPDLFASMSDCAQQIPDHMERTLALARLAEAGVGPVSFEELEGDLFRLVNQVRTETGGLGPTAIWDGSPATPLLRWESRLGSAWIGSLPWAAVTCAALCAAALAAIRSAEPGIVAEELPLWRRLLVDDQRDEAARKLRRLGRERLLRLDPEKCSILGRLLSEGAEGAAAGILAVSRLLRHLPEVDTWRGRQHQRVADLATLLVIEAGRLDRAAVATLPRLLADEDDLVRLRAALATGAVSRGSTSRPRFGAAGLGPAACAELARQTLACKRDAPRLSGDLWWALSDVVHDSLDTLRATLELLADEPTARLELLASIRQVTPEVFAELPGFAGHLGEAEQLCLVYALQLLTREPERSGLQQDDAARLREPLAELAADTTDEVRAEVECLLGRVLPPTVPSLIRLVRTATAGLDPTGAGKGVRAVGAAYGAGILLARATDPAVRDDPAAVAAVGELRQLAETADEKLAVEAAAGLWLAADEAYLHGALRDGRLDAATLLWAKIETLPTTVGRDYRHTARRIAEFVHRPPVFPNADAAYCTDQMMAALLTRATAVMSEDWPADQPGRSGMRYSWELDNLLAVLTELARLQPAALRTAVTAGYPQFLPGLIRTCEAAPRWLVREYAPRLLILLGQGDRDTVRAILDTALDSDIVRQGVLGELDWFEYIADDGFALLLDALTGPRLSRCHLAVRMLSSLLRHHALDDNRHAEALRAVQLSMMRPDAGEPLLAEHGGQIKAIGSYADVCREDLVRLVTGRRPRVPAFHGTQFVLRFRDANGRDAEFVAPDDGAEPPGGRLLGNQLEYYLNAEARQFPGQITLALARCAQAARAAGVSLFAVLSAAGEALGQADT
jgi:hypothetical protein